MKLQWTHAELLTALAAPARRATDGVARTLGLRAEGADDSIGGEANPPQSSPPLRPDAAWARSARALVRPGWVAPSPVDRHESPHDSATPPDARPATASPWTASPSALSAPQRPGAPLDAEPIEPFEPLGAHPVTPTTQTSVSLGFEPLNHPLLREAPRADRAVYDIGDAPARAAWTTFDPDPFDGRAPRAASPQAQAPTSLDFEPSPTPSATAPAFAPSAQPTATQPGASLEFEPSATPERASRTSAALAPIVPAAETQTATDLEVLGEAFSDPFVAWRPGGHSAAPAKAASANVAPDDAPLPAHTTRLALHPAPRQDAPPLSTMELQGAEAPRPLRLRDLGRATPAASPPTRAPAAPTRRAPLDELFDDVPPELEALPEGPAFSTAPLATSRAIPSAAAPGPAAAPSPARLRPAMADAFEPEAPPSNPPSSAPSTSNTAKDAPGLPAAPPTPTAAPQAVAGLDRDSLEEAMTEVLRDAARQHGLEV